MTFRTENDPPQRLVEMEIEVPGTPEDVWRALATGPGMTAWFVPTTVEEREGGEIAFDLGAFGGSKGVVTGWEPPRRFAYVEHEWMPGAPPVATEVHVAAKGGGTCVVRMVHSLFTDRDDWDDQLKGFEQGWPGFFAVLRLYLSRFAGEPCRQARASGRAEDADTAWATLGGALGVADAEVGDAVASAPDAPPLAGVVERAGERELLVRLERPAPGAAYLAAHAMGGQVYVVVTLYLYGDVAAVAAEAEGEWRRWIEARFPAPAS